MAWFITDGVLEKAELAPHKNSILTQITGFGNVVIPNGVTKISKNAFCGCTDLESIFLPDSVKRIEKAAFYNCFSLTHVRLSQRLTTIGEQAFSRCLHLSCMELPDSVRSIGECAFSGCLELESFVLSQQHPHFRIENDMLISKDGTLIWAAPDQDFITVPDGVISIGSEVFSGWRTLLCATLPDSVRRIGNRAFAWCDNLSDISAPAELTSIGKEAFCFCLSLRAFPFPDGVREIGFGAFQNCESLREIILPNGLTKIENMAFTECTALTKLTLPDSLKTIGNRAFAFCMRLSHVALPDGLTSIEDEALSRCYSLNQITLPDSVSKVGSDAFCGGTHLIASAHHWTHLTNDALKKTKVISCPISLKDASPRVRLKLCIGFALYENRYSDPLRGEYIAYIQSHASKLAEAAFDIPDLLRFMCREKLISAKEIDAFSAEAVRRENVELTALLLKYQAEILTMSDICKVRERREKVQQRQDDALIARIEARADKVGIDGLNFAAVGRLKNFKKRDDLKAYVTERSATLQSSISSKTDYLIANCAEPESKIYRKAEQMGIAIISEREFMQMAQSS